MEVLEKAAIQLGSSTRYSASQVTGLQTELAKLGFTVKEITDMSPAVLNFAGSVGTDLASAAALAGVALRSFNLGSDQTEDALGTMAVACNKSALSFEYLQNSFSTIAPVAKTYGLSLKDTIALLGTLANAGFDASSAATATRNILLNLSDTNGKLAKALGGSVHSFEDIMAAMKNLRDQGVDLNTTLELTDKRSVAAFNTFLDGAESAQTLRGELEDVNGELQRMAEQRANTVEGAIDGMKSAWEGLVLSFRNSTGTFKDVFNGIANGIRGLTLLLSRDNRISAWADNAKDEVQRVYDEFGPEYFEMWVESRNKEFAQLFTKAGGGRKQKRKGDEWMGFKQAVENVDTEEKDISLAKRLDQIERVYDAKVAQFKADVTLSEEEVEARIAEAKKKHDDDRTAAIKKESDRMKRQAEEEKKAAEDAAKKKNEVDEKQAKKEEAARKQAYSKQKSQLDAYLNYQEKSLKVQWLQGEMGEAEYNSMVYQAKAKYYQDMLALAKKYGQDDSAIRNKMLDDHIKALEAEKKRVKEEMEEMMKVYASEHPDQNMSDEDFNKLRDNQRRQGYKEKLGTIPGETDKEFDARIEQYEAFQEKILAKAADIRAAITEDSARTQYETEMKWIEKLHKDGLLSDEEFEKAKMDQKLGFAAKIAQEVNRYAEMASNFSNALKEAETAQLEAQYQRQLTAAGDNAERREQIDAEYEQKKLDLQKKYADVDMAINIAKTVANGAAAVVKALADPGGVAGYILAGLVGVTTAAEIATIIAQRNAIKATSVGGGGSSSIPKTGERKMTGYSEGGFTPKAASDSTAVGVVHANEYVAPAWMVRQNPVTFANLERYRKAGSHGRSGSMSRGFADGGFTPGKGGGSSATMPEQIDIEAAVEAAIRRVMADGAIRAYVVRKDIEELDAQTLKFKKLGSR
jgi:TP901 family phage tail tape measure protein